MHRHFINIIFLDPQPLGRTYHPLSGLNSSPRQMGFCMLPMADFLDPKSAGCLLGCTHEALAEDWRLGRWLGESDGFPSSSLCRGEASRDVIPSEVAMALGLQDPSAPCLSTLQVGMVFCYS